MAKRYTVHHTIPVGTPSDPNEFAVQGQVDLCLLLSQRLQKNIRQGRVINIHSVKASIDAPESGNLDLGGAISGEIRFAPATKNSCKAWRHLFSIWRKQKMLKVGAAGPMVRYDDFELALSSDHITSRTSTVYAGGLTDGDSEHCVVYGNSTEGEDITLEDIYESLQPQALPSRFPIGNTTVKEPKFTEEFPPIQSFPFGTSWSTTDPQAGHDSGAQVQQPTTYINDSASLCGLVYYQGQLLPENTTGHVQDDLNLTLTFTVSIGMPLAKVPGRSRARMSKRSRYAKGNVRASRASNTKKAAWKRYRK